MDAEIEEASLRWAVFRGRRTDADDVFAHRPVIGHEDLDVVHVELRRMPGLRAEIRAPIHVGHADVILVILQPACAQRIVREVGVVLAFLVEAEIAGIRRTGNAGPFAAEAAFVRIRLLPDRGDDVGVFWQRRCLFHGLHPLLRPLLGVDLVLHEVSHLRGRRLGFVAHRFLDGRGGLPLKGFRQGLEPESLILLELVARHEKVRPRRVEALGGRVGRELAHIDLHAEQFAERVAVFAAVQPPHGDGSLLVAKAPPGRDHHVGQIIQEIGLCHAFRLLLVVGRHGARIQLVEHLLPALRRFERGDGERQIVHAEAALLLLLVVAFAAVFFKQGLMLRRHGHDRSLLRGESDSVRQQQGGDG